MSVNNDLDEILQVFFEETDDHLTSLETLLSGYVPTGFRCDRERYPAGSPFHQRQ